MRYFVHCFSIICIFFSSVSHVFAADLCFQQTKDKEYKKAINTCDDYIRRGGGEKGLAWNYYARGHSYFELGNYAAAIIDLSKSIELGSVDNKYLPALFNERGRAFLRTKQYEQAVIDFNKTVELNPKEKSVAYYNIACAHALSNNVTSFCEWFNKAIKTGYNRWDHVKKDPDLDSVRNTSCYKGLMTDR